MNVLKLITCLFFALCGNLYAQTLDVYIDSLNKNPIFFQEHYIEIQCFDSLLNRLPNNTTTYRVCNVDDLKAIKNFLKKYKEGFYSVDTLKNNYPNLKRYRNISRKVAYIYATENKYTPKGFTLLTGIYEGFDKDSLKIFHFQFRVGAPNGIWKYYNSPNNIGDVINYHPSFDSSAYCIHVRNPNFNGTFKDIDTIYNDLNINRIYDTDNKINKVGKLILYSQFNDDCIVKTINYLPFVNLGKIASLLYNDSIPIHLLPNNIVILKNSNNIHNFILDNSQSYKANRIRSILFSNSFFFKVKYSKSMFNYFAFKNTFSDQYFKINYNKEKKCYFIEEVSKEKAFEDFKSNKLFLKDILNN